MDNISNGHYKQIVVNMFCDDSIEEADLQILKEKIEDCVLINSNPEVIKDVRVRVN